MNEISPKFDSTDSLLLYSVAYRQRHGEIRTLGGILLTTDAINRSFPMANELEDGFSRLIVGGFIGLLPAGGVTWDYVQYPVGFKSLGRMPSCGINWHPPPSTDLPASLAYYTVPGTSRCCLYYDNELDCGTAP